MNLFCGLFPLISNGICGLIGNYLYFLHAQKNSEALSSQGMERRAQQAERGGSLPMFLAIVTSAGIYMAMGLLMFVILASRF